jgi:hypothetical protein
MTMSRATLPLVRRWTLMAPLSIEPELDMSDPVDDVLWMPAGDWDFASRIAYAFLSEDATYSNPAPFIRAAIRSVASAVHFRMFPSSRGP